jgi:hypothetical protein
MSRFALVMFAAVFTGGVYAQVTLPSHYGSPTGFGNIMYPGVGHAPTTIPRGGGAFIGPRMYGNAAVPPPVRHPGHSRQVIVPYPVYVGGYGYGLGYGYDVGAQAPAAYGPEDASMMAAPQQPAAPPVVIINQAYKPETVTPMMHDYSDPQAQSGTQNYIAPVHPFPDPNEARQGQPVVRVQDDKPTLYLLAFRDHTILPALAYWVEGDTLNYVTEGGVPNRASLTLIDKEFSKELNKQRSVEFNLP